MSKLTIGIDNPLSMNNILLICSNLPSSFRTSHLYSQSYIAYYLDVFMDNATDYFYKNVKEHINIINPWICIDQPDFMVG